MLGSPPSDGLDGARVIAWFQLDGDPLPVAMFNLMGVWPLAFAGVLLLDPPQRVPAWPFVALSFAVGAVARLPYLALRQWGTDARPSPGRIRRALTGRQLAAVLTAGAAGIVTWGLGWGSTEAFAELWATSGLVTTMTADFLVLTLIWYPVLLDDWGRHGGPAWAAALGAIPVVGAPLWLVFRPNEVRSAL